MNTLTTVIGLKQFFIYIIKSLSQCQMRYWNSYNGPRLCQDLIMKRPSIGHPKSTRIRNEMDTKKSGQHKHCGLCQNEGYSCRNCSSVVGPSRRS